MTKRPKKKDFGPKLGSPEWWAASKAEKERLQKLHEAKMEHLTSKGPFKPFDWAAFNQEVGEKSKEQALVHKLILEMADNGYRALAMQFHPDKGGSAEAMARLNNARAQLKERLQDSKRK